MKNSILFEENHFFDVLDEQGRLVVHIDYGTRSVSVNMVFQHFHEYHEIHVLLSGECNHILEGTMYPLRPLDVVLIRPFLLHKTTYSGERGSRRLILTFNLDHLLQIFPQDVQNIQDFFAAEVPILRGTDESIKESADLLNGLFLVSKGNSPVGQLKAFGLFLELLCALMKLKKENMYIPQRAGNPLVGKIQEVVAYLHAHYNQSLNLEGMARKFNISRYYLARQFKHITGYTFITYIQLIRVRRSQELLMTTQLKIIDIAENCGFGSLSQFNRTFLQHCGMSPLKYRRQYRNV
jgi:AraC-like DNA-binding protein